ncbi:hypothetical protein HanXRQr2_Chr08g0343131 [Helianthus annuus]|uniref:Uncharacterized protein n=1 Tax=Helianthus annuus TaxID=4232 RepID=A0A9K3NCX8_HELAN|nr:hypothetical protein HanXRQr2_Chr08g0343131 [Helianthus annuus]KAJ0901959.1 hypothetical protein HanPSC8_Chr08g0331431 [Helianthus annuus]
MLLSRRIRSSGVFIPGVNRQRIRGDNGLYGNEVTCSSCCVNIFRRI